MLLLLIPTGRGLLQAASEQLNQLMTDWSVRFGTAFNLYLRVTVPLTGALIVGADVSVGALINGGCTNIHAVTWKPFGAVASTGTYCEMPVVFMPLTTTFGPVVWLSEMRLEGVDQVIVFGALAGKTVALTVAVVWLETIDCVPFDIPIPYGRFPSPAALVAARPG